MAAELDIVPRVTSPHLCNSPVTGTRQPLFARAAAGIVSPALRTLRAHCNGFPHGNVDAMPDNAMGAFP